MTEDHFNELIAMFQRTKYAKLFNEEINDWKKYNKWANTLGAPIYQYKCRDRDTLTFVIYRRSDVYSDGRWYDYLWHMYKGITDAITLDQMNKFIEADLRNRLQE